MVFGLFSRERKLQRIIKKATNKLTQSPERWAAMEKLRDEGTDEALYHLLRRFTFSYTKMVEDEQEKEWVVETMVAKGEAGLPALRRYLKSNTTIAHALHVLERVASQDKILEIIDELLADEDPDYTRDTTKRIQILDWLGEWKGASDAEIAKRIVPYLADFDENTRFAAAEALSNHAVPEVTEALVAAMVRADEQSNRLKVRIAELLSQAQLDLGDHKKQVAPLLADVLSDFRLQRDRLVHRQ